MDDWMSIETAPKDGTRVLLMSVIDTRRFTNLPAIGWIRIGHWAKHHRDGYEAAWREDHIGGYGDASRFRLVPTHWRPLPEAPG